MFRATVAYQFKLNYNRRGFYLFYFVAVYLLPIYCFICFYLLRTCADFRLSFAGASSLRAALRKYKTFVSLLLLCFTFVCCCCRAWRCQKGDVPKTKRERVFERKIQSLRIDTMFARAPSMLLALGGGMGVVYVGEDEARRLRFYFSPPTARFCLLYF